MAATLTLKSTTGLALPQEPIPSEYAYLTWDEPPRWSGASDVPLWFDSPDRERSRLFSRCRISRPARAAGCGHSLWHWSAAAYRPRSEEHKSELQSLMRISYAVFCLTKKNT